MLVYAHTCKRCSDENFNVIKFCECVCVCDMCVFRSLSLFSPSLSLSLSFYFPQILRIKDSSHPTMAAAASSLDNAKSLIDRIMQDLEADDGPTNLQERERLLRAVQKYFTDKMQAAENKCKIKLLVEHFSGPNVKLNAALKALVPKIYFEMTHGGVDIGQELQTRITLCIGEYSFELSIDSGRCASEPVHLDPYMYEGDEDNVLGEFMETFGLTSEVVTKVEIVRFLSDVFVKIYENHNCDEDNIVENFNDIIKALNKPGAGSAKKKTEKRKEETGDD